MKEEDHYEVTDEAIVTVVNSDGNKLHDQASIVEPNKIFYKD